MSELTPNIFPTLRYADADAALEWLSRAFGFRERAVYRDESGTIHHAELTLDRGIVMLGQGDPGIRGIYVAVADADSHYARAKAAGARIAREIEDTPYGSREYSVLDSDGHRWSFGTYDPYDAAGKS